MKKLKIGNLLKFITVSIVILCIVFLFFLLDSYNIPKPQIEIYPGDELVEFTSVQNNYEESLQSETDISSFYTDYDTTNYIVENDTGIDPFRNFQPSLLNKSIDLSNEIDLKKG